MGISYSVNYRLKTSSLFCYIYEKDETVPNFLKLVWNVSERSDPSAGLCSFSWRSRFPSSIFSVLI